MNLPPPIVIDARKLLSDRCVTVDQIVVIRNRHLVRLGIWLIFIGARVAGYQLRLEKVS